ncbi:MAG: Rpn family recombination-promoting nuclease/putative transposase [Clostridiales bacterium]|nr:Rpn family recombination-promoting nuclease/putative transposase [Clostridiales bacterium]
MKLQNPHDKFFKETFSNLEVAKDFIQNYLPESIVKIIDLDTLELQKDSFINEKLQEVFSDMLFRVSINNNDAYIYFLFEHKSYISKQTALQLLKYMVEIWEMNIKKEGVGKLPIIIPLVIYHGSERWRVKTNLGDIIEGYNDLGEEIKRYIPNFEYLLYDLSMYKDEDIKGHVQLRIMLSILRDIFIKDARGIQETILKAASYLSELEDKQTGIQYFETYMRYIFSSYQDMTRSDFENIARKIEKTFIEGSEEIMTLADMFREEGMKKGIEEGIKEGIEKGIEKGEIMALVKTAIKLLTKKFGIIPIELKQKLQELDVSTLEIIVENILDMESLDELNKYIK